MLFVFNGPGVRTITATQCQQLENRFEIDRIKDLLVGDPIPQYIKLHMEFPNACLSRLVLLIASHGHRHHYGTDDMPPDENRVTLYAVNCEFLYNFYRMLRFLAYRQLAWWGWGQYRCVVLPSCTVA